MYGNIIAISCVLSIHEIHQSLPIPNPIHSLSLIIGHLRVVLIYWQCSTCTVNNKLVSYSVYLQGTDTTVHLRGYNDAAKSPGQLSNSSTHGNNIYMKVLEEDTWAATGWSLCASDLLSNTNFWTNNGQLSDTVGDVHPLRRQGQCWLRCLFTVFCYVFWCGAAFSMLDWCRIFLRISTRAGGRISWGSSMLARLVYSLSSMTHGYLWYRNGNFTLNMIRVCPCDENFRL